MVVAAMMASCCRVSRKLTNSGFVVVLLLATIFSATIPQGHGVHVKAAGTRPNAIFAFGDSYLDTGNRNKTDYIVNRPWLAPYGITYPGSPTGRFSDGRVFTDIFAEALGMPVPVSYEQRLDDPKSSKYGMNFAVGGAGALNPYGMLSFRGQVDQFESLSELMYPKEFLANSAVLVGIHGNDYGAYLNRGYPISAIGLLETQVIDEMVLQMERLYKLGLKSFYVNNIEPMGCLPSSTKPDFKACNEISNGVSIQHNKLLDRAVASLRTRLSGATFTILDHFMAFTTVLQNPAKYGISSSPLVSCCLGFGNDSRSCGEYDTIGQPLFKVCANPVSSFFWDTIHPTQAGWTAVAKVLFPNAVLEPVLIKLL